MHSVGLLFYPKIRSSLAAWRSLTAGRIAPVAVVTIAFWAVVYAVFFRMLVYFRSVEDIGVLLTVKLVSMTLVSILLILVVSNLLSAFNTFFFSDDLYLLHSSPVSAHSVYMARFTETLAHASWMILVMAVPVFAALGQVFEAGWEFYLMVPLVLLPLAVIPTSLGIIIAMLLVNVFMARRTRDVLSFLSVALLGAVIIAFRFMNPEKVLLRHDMENITAFFSLLRSPDSPLSPHFWGGRVILDLLGLRQSDSLFFMLVLAAVSLGSLSLAWYTTRFLYTRGFSRSQEGETRRIRGSRLFERLMGLYLRIVPPAGRQLVLKDIKTLLRDRGQWSQVFLLAGMVAIYLYNFSVMPLNRNVAARPFLAVLMNFLNLGLAGFVIAAVSSRFVFPGVSLEGRSFWLLRSAPLGMGHFVRSKALVLALPLVLLGQLLVVVSSRILHAGAAVTVLACLVVLTLTVALVALGTGMGAIFPRFDVENPANIPTGMGGIFYMIASMALIGVSLLLLARPVWMLLWSQMRGTELSAPQWALVAALCAATVALHLAVAWKSLAAGSRALERMEF